MELSSGAVLTLKPADDQVDQRPQRSERSDRPQTDRPNDTDRNDRIDRGERDDATSFRSSLDRSESQSPPDEPTSVEATPSDEPTVVDPSLVDARLVQEVPVALLMGNERPVDLLGDGEEDPLLALAAELIDLPFAETLLQMDTETTTVGGEQAADGSIDDGLALLLPGDGEEGDTEAEVDTGAAAQQVAMPVLDPTAGTTATGVDGDTGDGEGADPLLGLTAMATPGGMQRGDGDQLRANVANHQAEQAQQQAMGDEAAGQVQRVNANHESDSVGLSMGESRSAMAVQAKGPVTPAVPMQAMQAQAEAGPADRAIANQVSRAVMAELPNGDRMLNLRLTPPELGTVRIQIIEHHGRLTVKMGAEDDGVRHALERSLPQLRQDLRASDAPIADLQLADSPFFDLRGRDQQQQDQRGGRRNGQPRFSIDGMPELDAETTADRAPRTTVIGPDSIDATV